MASIQYKNRNIDTVILTITNATGWEGKAIESLATQSYFHNKKIKWYIASNKPNDKIEAFASLTNTEKSNRIRTIVDDDLSYTNIIRAVMNDTTIYHRQILHYNINKPLPPTAITKLRAHDIIKYSGGFLFASKSINLGATFIASRTILDMMTLSSRNDKELINKIARAKNRVGTGITL